MLLDGIITIVIVVIAHSDIIIDLIVIINLLITIIIAKVCFVK